MEKIKAAALTYQGETFEATSHGIAFAQLRAKYPRITWFKESDGFREGFTTTNGRFVDRAEANRVASLADQIDDGAKNRDVLSAEWLKEKN